MMADIHDSCSMTPPMSPSLAFPMDSEDFLEEMDIPDKEPEVSASYPYFHCLGEARLHAEYHREGPLRSGVLDRLLQKSPRVSGILQSPTIELLGFQFVNYALEEQMDTLFYMLRDFIGRLDDIGAVTETSDTTTDYVNVRTEVLQFFDYILAYIDSCLPTDGSARHHFLQCLLQHIKGFLVFLGPIHQLAPHVIYTVTPRGPQTSSRAHHLLHAYLDIYWAVLGVLHTIQVDHGGLNGFNVSLYHQMDSDDSDIFHQVVSLLLWDVSVLAVNVHNKSSVCDVMKQSPFPCRCIQELLALLMKLLEERQRRHAKQSLWVCMNPILEKIASAGSEAQDEHMAEIDCDEFEFPPNYVCQNRLGFSWWYLLHLAALFKDVDGTVCSNYYIAQVLLKPSLTSGACAESQLRLYLRCLLEITNDWEPNVDTLIVLWDHFYKRLNDHFQSSSGTLRDFASLNTSIQVWLDECRARCRGDTANIEQESSFLLFLRLLSVQISKTASSGGGVWRQMKGRFYSKFHGRRLQELSDIGLQNFTSLFLTLAYTTQQLEDVSAKLCDLYNTLNNVKLEFSRRLVIWRGLFALMLLYVEKGVDAGVIADSLAQEANKVTSELSQAGISGERYHSLWKLMTVYLEGLQDVIQASPRLALNEHKLIGSGFRDLIGNCRENELCLLLSTVQTILTKHRVVYKRFGSDPSQPSHLHYRGLSDALWTNFFEFVRSHAATLTPPPQLADVAAGFTMLVSDLPPSIHSGMKADFLSCFQYFGWSETVCARISCRFLVHLMSNQSAMEQLSRDLPQHELHLIQAWFRCCWQLLAPGNDEMKEVTRLVLKLPFMTGLFSDADIAPGDHCNHTSLAFIRALGKSYVQVNDLQGKIEFQTNMKLLLGDVTKHMSPVLKAHGPQSPELLSNVFNLAGHLVKHCAAFLYIKSRPDCLLPVLIGRLVLPRQLLHANRQVAPAHIAAIGKHLHLFLDGLAQLDFKRDPYVQRKLRDILHQHFSRFPMKMGACTPNPFVASMMESCSNSPPEEFVVFRHHLMELLRIEYLKLQGTLVPSMAQQALSVIVEVMTRTLDHSVLARDSLILLRTCLDYQLLCDQVNLRHCATRATQYMMEAVDKCSALKEGPELFRIFEEFFNAHLALHQGKVFRVLEVAGLLAPQLLARLMPALTAGVKANEAKRGVGIDKQLRLAYCNLLRHLGRSGQEEKSKLLMEANLAT